MASASAMYSPLMRSSGWNGPGERPPPLLGFDPSRGQFGAQGERVPPTRSSGRNAASGQSLDTTTAAGKLLALLDAFGPEQPDFSLAELAVRSGLPKSTTHRILAALELWRGVERSVSGRYRLGIKFFELGGLVPDRLRLREVALPYMEDLLATTREMVHLAKLDGTDVLYIERLVSHRSVRSPSRVAGRVPATPPGVGPALLAFRPPGVVTAG